MNAAIPQEGSRGGCAGEWGEPLERRWEYQEYRTVEAWLEGPRLRPSQDTKPGKEQGSTLQRGDWDAGSGEPDPAGGAASQSWLCRALSAYQLAPLAWRVAGSGECEISGDANVQYVCACVCVWLSHVQLFATPWTLVCQAPLSQADGIAAVAQSSSHLSASENAFRSVKMHILVQNEQWTSVPAFLMSSRATSNPTSLYHKESGPFNKVFFCPVAYTSKQELISKCPQCAGVKSCLTLSDHMDYSTPCFPVLHHLQELAQTHVHWVSDVIPLSHPLFVPFSSCPQSFPASGSFQMSRLFESGGQSTGASASASVLLMNIQGWFPLGSTGLQCPGC